MSDETFECPHCRIMVRARVSELLFGSDQDSAWGVDWTKCPHPECDRVVAWLVSGESTLDPLGRPVWVAGPKNLRLIRPDGHGRPPCPREVPDHVAADYNEACATFPVSKKASAALSRRSLQAVLRDAADVTPADLSKEIQEVLDKDHLPPGLADSIDGIRNVGNYAAHPNKSTHTGEIVDVEPQEAEWCLEILEELFDHYYVKPARILKRREALNSKLSESGKPPMK